MHIDCRCNPFLFSQLTTMKDEMSAVIKKAIHEAARRIDVTPVEPYKKIGTEIGLLVEEKNAAYGSSFAKAGEFLRLLYPDGIAAAQYADALLLVRIFDKQMRIATNRDALGESPYRDIAGYGILGASLHETSNHPLGVNRIAEAREVPAPVSAPRMRAARKESARPVLRKRVLHEGLSRTKPTQTSGKVSTLRRVSPKKRPPA